MKRVLILVVILFSLMSYTSFAEGFNLFQKDNRILDIFLTVTVLIVAGLLVKHLNEKKEAQKKQRR